jgi:hypothetical protein
MLDVLRTERTRLTLALVDYASDQSAEATMLPFRGRKTTTQPNRFVHLRTTILNQSREFYLLIFSLFDLQFSKSSNPDDERDDEPE